MDFFGSGFQAGSYDSNSPMMTGNYMEYAANSRPMENWSANLPCITEMVFAWSIMILPYSGCG